MSGPISRDRAAEIVADAEPLLHPLLEYRKLFANAWPIEEFILKAHPDWDKWVAYIETQFNTDRTNDPVIISLAFAVNRVELPPKYQGYLVEALQKYLLRGLDLENAFFGFKHKFSYDKRWRDAHRYRTYFTAMLMAQTLPGENASKQLEIMIEPRDLAKQASIYRYFLAWKKSPDGMAVARMYANV